MRNGIVVFTSVLLLGSCTAQPQAPPFQLTADVSQLMTTMIDPAADAFWNAVGTVISAEGVDHWEPRTDEEWAVVVNGAMTMTEAANLLMMGDRARDQDTWMQMAQGLVDAGRLALEAAEARDTEAVFALGEEVYNACDRCHNLYWVGDRGARP